jgi:1-acyl-sn-glycerol-3-phosphate acyltransferase
MNQREAAPGTADERVLEVVAGLARELHPRRVLRAVTLDMRFDRDLGFDSLARVELMLRVERATGRALPEQMLALAETPRDLLDALQAAPLVVPTAAAGTVPTGAASAVAAAAGAGAAEPLQASTLLEVLEWHARLHPERVHIVLGRERGNGLEEQSITHAALLQAASAAASALQAHGLQPGDTVAIMLPTGADYFSTFFGAMLAGGIPVPLYPPLRASQLEDYLRRQSAILSNCRARILVTLGEAKAAARLLVARAPDLRRVLTADELREGGARFERPRVNAEDLAFLQYTSGSTGNPKGVMLSHANLLANLRAMGRAVQASSADVFVSWLPLYHDMGLIGAWFGSLYYGARLVAMSPLAFLGRPARWLRAIHRHRGTLGAGPNFAYELCVRKIEDGEIEGLDLSSWRLAFNGAEPVSADTIAAFTRRFARYGFSPAAMAPVYGLAECCVGLAFPPLARGPLVDSVDRDALARDGRALPLPPEDARALRVVACGQALPGHDMRIVDEAGREVGERTEGRLQFKGPSATRGYYRNPEATRELLRGEWLDSGDLAYTVNDEIYITGRAKDVVIRAGRKLHPQEIEDAIGGIAGVRRGCVAVFGSQDPRHGTERLVVVAESNEQEPAALDTLRARIEEAVLSLIGEPPDEVVLAPPHSVPKTSSGKLRRQASRQLYERGEIGRAAPAAAWQALRYAWSGAVPQLRRLLRVAVALLYAGYAWSVFWIAAAGTLLGVLVLPGLARRRKLGQLAARLIVGGTRTPFLVHGAENLPVSQPCVVICNHASYADAVALLAAFPFGFRFAFLVKRELAARWAARLVIERTGMLPVERADVQRSVQDAGLAAQRLQDGDSLVVFAEGTLRRTAGLHPFHLGGFEAAAQARVPVVPVAIRGTRAVLRGDQWFPRRAAVSIAIGAPVPPPASADPFAAALALRDAARAFILQHCGEPDLAA